ncbi:MAG: secretin N-terminal domain-containing protein [Fimbriimonas sp.]|nr:secretin N-terminal domain-containing protein [Fimbriimonas sp.]
MIWASFYWVGCVLLKAWVGSKMSFRRKSFKTASLTLAFLPILSLCQDAKLGAPGVSKGTPPTAQGASKGSPQAPASSAGPSHTVIPEVGDPWENLKLDSKVRIKLSFRNANIDNIIAMLEKASHVTIVKDPQLTGPMTVTTADPVGISEAFHIFNTVLKLKGYELTRDKKILIVTLLKKEQPQPPPMPMMPAQPAVDPNATVVKFYPLQFASANQVARAINEVFAAGGGPQPGQPFGIIIGGPGGRQPQPGGGGPQVHASYEEFSNSVIVNAPAAQQTQVADLIKEIDKQQSQPLRTKSYDLVYANASDVLPTVQSVIEANASKGRGAKDNSNQFLSFIFGFGGSNQNTAVADSRTNSVIVTATEELLTITDKLIEGLDHKMPITSTTFVFRLKSARADTVANLLTAAFGPRQGSQTNNRTTTITPTNNAFNNTPPTNTTSGSRPSGSMNKPDDQSLALKMQDPNSSSGDLLTSVGVTQRFGQGFGDQFGRRSTGESMGHDPQGKVIGVHDLTGQVTAIADPNTNSVIVVTAPDNVELVKKVLDELDILPEQVMIQTVVVEASLDRSKQFGLEWSFAQSKLLGNSGANGTGNQKFGLQNANPALQGFSYALTGSDLTAFFNMLQTDTKFQVLSTPRIFTTNNMEAQINISQSVPYVLSTIQNITGTNSFNYGFLDVGIVLTVTPHITSNGYVTMDVVQTANDLQGYTTFNAPIVNQREAETTVSAKDGETIILGGIISNQVTSTVNKLPLFGDIPVLGNLFRSTSHNSQKTELLVFLTPRVVRDPAEAKRLREETERDMSSETTKMIGNKTKSKTGGSN